MVTWLMFGAMVGEMLAGNADAVVGALVFATWALWREQDR
jgi:hypothetical protein